MSNLEITSAEFACTAAPADGIEVLRPRDVPLGGPRAILVRRTLPQRERSLIGAWCFVDHYGPQDIGRDGGMDDPRIRTPVCRRRAGCFAGGSSTVTAPGCTQWCAPVS